MANNHPQSLVWQGQTVYFLQTKLITGVSGCPTRYDYGSRHDKHIVMMFFDFGQGIDWQALEAANKAAPKFEAGEYREFHIQRKRSRKFRNNAQKNSR